MADDTTIIDDEGTEIIHGNMKVNGNLEVGNQLTAHGLEVVGQDGATAILTNSAGEISFRKACEFTKSVQFNNGQTIIGHETTYNSAYIASPTIQAGSRLIVGDSALKIDSSDKQIIADTFRMSLRSLVTDLVVSKKEQSDLVVAKKVNVTDELIGNKIYADTIKTNNLFLDNIQGMNLQAANSLKTTDLIVGGSAKISNDLTISGTGVTGGALIVNGGQIIANKGIIANTKNIFFQTLQITGGGEKGICFVVDKDVDSLIKGDVTIQDSKLILDGSKLITDNVTVTPLSQASATDPIVGVQLSTKGNWETYKEEMVEEVPAHEAPSLDNLYDPVAEVQGAMQRTANNYENAHQAVKSLINPIQYLTEQHDRNIPKKFIVKQGVYRVDHTGNALLKNVVSEKGTFSQLDAYKFNVNRLSVDKILTTSVASNVVDTDNLLKSRGIAEFDGAVNSRADIFIEDGSSVEVANGSKVTFQSGSKLSLRNGATLEMGTDTQVKMSGDTELDLDKLVFFDSKTNRRYRISFVETPACHGGNSILMTYERLPDKTNEEIAEETELDSRELDDKLKSLGI